MSTIQASEMEDKNGIVVQFVDQEARDKVRKLSEEIGNINALLETI